MRSGVVSDVVYHGVHVTRKKTYGIYEFCACICIILK